MNIYVIVRDIDGNATGPLVVTKIRAYNNGVLVAATDVIATQVLPSDTAQQIQAKCKQDISDYIQIVTGSAPAAGSTWVVFGGRSN